MSVSIACEFVSYRSSFSGTPCESEATHRTENTDLCRKHWVYATSAVRTCSLCTHPLYEDYHVFVEEHACSSWDMGFDCMHFEDTEYCHCDDDGISEFQDARTAFVAQVIATCAEMPENWECQECEYGVPDVIVTDPDADYCDDCVKLLDWRWARTGYDG